MTVPPVDWPRVRAVFEHAVTLSVSARSAYIEAACGRDVRVRHQVERMLSSHDNAGQFLETPLDVPLADFAVSANLEGTRIGPYQLDTRIGAGGMGDVYRARDARLGRSVAIKVLPSHVVNDAQVRERFDREARLIATLNHPHICVLHDVGEATVTAARSHDDNRDTVTVRYLVMELLEGETLAARLSRAPLPMDEALHYAAQIASALDRAHRSGIVHRDLKPSNIFLVPADGTSPAFTTKLLDFGLAKQDGGSDALDRVESSTSSVVAADRTGSGLLLGTLRYMAPEQVKGEHTDFRTDIYAFGLVLFEMLTGRQALDGHDHEPASLARALPSAPGWLHDLVARCLTANPDERWQTARDILLELQAPVTAPTSGAPSLTTPRTGARGEKRNTGSTRHGRVAVAPAVALTVLVVAILAMLVWRAGLLPGRGAPRGASNTSDAPALVVLPIRSLDATDSAAAHVGTGLADAIATNLAKLQAIRVRPTTATASLQAGAITPAAVGQRLSVDHVLTGTVRRTSDGYRFTLQLIRTADDVLVWGRQIDVNERDLFSIEDQVSGEVATALQLQMTSTEPDRWKRGSMPNPDAYGEYLQGRALLTNYSDSNLREAINHFERALQIDPDYGLAHAGIATAAGIFSVRFAYEPQAIDWGRRAEQYATRALKQDANLAEAHLALASAAGTLYRNFDWATVIQEARVALMLNRNLDLAHSALARAYYHLGLLDLSEAESQRAEEISGGTNVEVTRVHLYNQLLAGHFDDARRMGESLMKRSNTVPVIQQYLGLATFYLGDGARAQEVLASVRRPDGHPDIRSQASLAGVLAADGRRTDAERTMRDVLDTGYMDHHVAYALGAAEAQLGHPDEAVKWLRTAAETGFPCYQWAERDTLLNPIRSNGRFQSFLAALRTDYDRMRAQYITASRTPD